jgi:hypothetical protein
MTEPNPGQSAGQPGPELETWPPETWIPVTDGDTARETALRTAESGERATDRGNTRNARARIPHWRSTVDRVWSVAVGDLPSVWSDAPATPAELVRYARDGEWCAPHSTRLRAVGRGYCWAIAIPASVAAYVAAWVVQRPGRLAAVLLLVVVLRLFTPVDLVPFV